MFQAFRVGLRGLLDRIPDAPGCPRWWPRWRTLSPQAGKKGEQPTNLLNHPQVTIILTALPFCLAGVLVSQATSVLTICLGRALAGLCIGAMSLSLPVYLAECLRPEVRGRLGLLPTTLGNLGVLICFICGAWFDWSEVRLVYYPTTICLCSWPQWRLSCLFPFSS